MLYFSVSASMIPPPMAMIAASVGSLPASSCSSMLDAVASDDMISWISPSAILLLMSNLAMLPIPAVVAMASILSAMEYATPFRNLPMPFQSSPNVFTSASSHTLPRSSCTAWIPRIGRYSSLLLSCASLLPSPARIAPVVPVNPANGLFKIENPPYIAPYFPRAFSRSTFSTMMFRADLR